MQSSDSNFDLKIITKTPGSMKTLRKSISKTWSINRSMTINIINQKFMLSMISTSSQCFLEKFLFFPQIIQQHIGQELPLKNSHQNHRTEVLTNRPEALASAKLTVRKGTSLLQALGVFFIRNQFSPRFMRFRVSGLKS